MGDLATLLPAGGVLVALALVIGYLINGNRLDRRDYREAIRQADAEAETERVRNTDLQRALDREREDRRKAQDAAAAATSAANRATEEIAALRRQLEGKS